MRFSSTCAALALGVLITCSGFARAGFDFRIGNIAYNAGGGTFSVYVDHNGGLPVAFDTIQYDLRLTTTGNGVALPINITSASNALPEFFQFSPSSGSLTAVGSTLFYQSSDGNGPPGRSVDSLLVPSLLVANYAYTVGNGAFVNPQAFSLDLGPNPFLANAGTGILPGAAPGQTFSPPGVPEPTSGLAIAGMLIAGVWRRSRRS